MTFRKLILLITLTCLSALCQAQLPDDFPVIAEGDIEGTVIARSRTFSGPALYGYINGGAELYHEYGFTDALITELTSGTDKYKVEIFRMAEPESAFGIYSVSRYKCIDAPALWKYSCRAKYQLQVCKGRFYVSIISSNGSRSDSIVSVKIARFVTEKIAGNDFDLSVFFPDSDNNPPRENIFLAKGRLGIVNGSPDLEDYFRGAENYTLVVKKLPDRRILSVRFSDPESLSEFVILHNWEDLQITPEGIKAPAGEFIRRLNDNHLYIEIHL